MWRKNSKVWILTAIFMCTAVPALAASTLTVGSRGDEVRSVQQGLRSKGVQSQCQRSIHERNGTGRVEISER